jgi:hypothetical protein
MDTLMLGGSKICVGCLRQTGRWRQGVVFSPWWVAFGSFPSDYSDSQVEVCHYDKRMGSPHFPISALLVGKVVRDEELGR